MGDDAYWRVPDGLDYRWEIELHHKRSGHIIQPFTSLSITHLNPLPPSAVSLQLRDTIRPVCYEGRVERSRQGHDNKLADGCRENKGHWRLDIIAIPISQHLSAAQRVWTARKRSERLPWPLTLWLPRYRDRRSPHCWHKRLQRWVNLAERTAKKMKCHLDVFHQNDFPAEKCNPTWLKISVFFSVYLREENCAQTSTKTTMNMDKKSHLKTNIRNLIQGVFLKKMWCLQTSCFIKLKCYLLGDCGSYSTNCNNFDKRK